MPKNFPEVWLKRVIRNLTAATLAPWLDGIAELDVDVTVMNAGAKTESNIIHVPTTAFRPDVLINNTAYPIALQEYTDDEMLIKLDKYQTKVVPLSDDQILGAAYDRIDAVTRTLTEAILIKKFGKAIHSLAPDQDSVNTPVLFATGPADASGRNILVYEDLVALKRKLDLIEAEATGRRLVLSTDHWNDLLLDRKNFGDQLVNYATGKPAPVIAGFELFSYVANPYFTELGVKKAYDAIPAGTDRRASIAFLSSNVAKKTGITKQYFRDSKTNPEYQSNGYAYRHYFMAVPMQKLWIGAIV